MRNIKLLEFLRISGLEFVVGVVDATERTPKKKLTAGVWSVHKQNLNPRSHLKIKLLQQQIHQAARWLDMTVLLLHPQNRQVEPSLDKKATPFEENIKIYNLAYLYIINTPKPSQTTIPAMRPRAYLYWHSRAMLSNRGLVKQHGVLYKNPTTDIDLE